LGQDRVFAKIEEVALEEFMRRSLRKMGVLIPGKEAMRTFNYILGSLAHWKGVLQEKWGHVTNSQLHILAGRRDKLTGKIRRSCNMDRDEAARVLDRDGEFSGHAGCPE
jgi:uncharacterized protein YjbJ (UPF0337 family)